MVLKKCIVGILLIFSAASIANAQIHGLIVSDTADPAGKGVFQIMANTFKNENSSLYGGRLAYGVTERLLLFTDIGNYKNKPENPAIIESNDIIAQAGMRYSLGFNLPFDLSIRSTIIPYVASWEHYIELTFGLLASRYLDARSNWAVYGSAGIDYQQWKLEFDFYPAYAAMLGQDSYVDEGDQTDLSVSLGLSVRLTPTTRFFLEAAHVADFYGCAGLRFDI